MQWFNWILRGGKKENLPDYVINADWVRQACSSQDQARQIIRELLEAGPLGEKELRSLTGKQIESYLQELLRAYRQSGRSHALRQGA